VIRAAAGNEKQFSSVLTIKNNFLSRLMLCDILTKGFKNNTMIHIVPLIEKIFWLILWGAKQ
jgi:hypothetical protein